jgi:hypothetical protein
MRSGHARVLYGSAADGSRGGQGLPGRADGFAWQGFPARAQVQRGSREAKRQRAIWVRPWALRCFRYCDAGRHGHRELNSPAPVDGGCADAQPSSLATVVGFDKPNVSCACRLFRCSHRELRVEGDVQKDCCTPRCSFRQLSRPVPRAAQGGRRAMGSCSSVRSGTSRAAGEGCV